MVRNEWKLYAFAAATWIWAFFRAHTQSITIDEADTYLMCVARVGPTYWISTSNNHILNSMLMKLSTDLFGLSHLSVRLPALLGALLFIAASVKLSLLITSKLYLRYLAFICLTWNPFVLDYLVAARGYSLAIGFSMCAIVVLFKGFARPSSNSQPFQLCAFASACLALAFAANFSFAFFLAMLGLAVAIAFYPVVSPWKLLVALLVPAAIITTTISGWTAAHMPHAQLWYGAKSFGQMATSLQTAVYDVPNEYLVSPLIRPLFLFLRSSLPVVLISVLVVSLIGFAGQRKSLQVKFALVLAAILASTLALHGLGYWFFDLLLPMDRTALYIAPLVALILVSLGASTSAGRFHYGLRILLIFVLAIHAVYFASTVRRSYFREWIWNADVKQAFDVAAWYTNHCGESVVSATWMYSPSLNYYRRALPQHRMSEVQGSRSPMANRRLFIFHPERDADFQQQEKLKLVFERRDIVVAIRPELESACADTAPLRSRLETP